MANHPNRKIIGLLKTSDGRTQPSYAVLERLKDGRYCTYMAHHDIGSETRAAYHTDYPAALARYEALEVAAANRR